MTHSLPLSPAAGLDAAHDPRGLGALLALAEGAEVAFPLQEVRVRATVVGSVVRTVVEQRFANTLTAPMEAVHIFPLPEDGALVELELRCGEVVVRADCRERQAAEEEFKAARAAGHRAALLTQERADVHTLRVTRLPPGEAVVVRMVVLEALVPEDGRFRLRFPTTVAPRYIPGNPTGHAGPGAHPDTDHAPDASRITPPLRLGGGTRLDIEVRFEAPPARLQSSLHALRYEFDGAVTVAPNGRETCNKDFVLAFAYTAEAASTRAWTDGEATLVLVEPPVAAGATLPRDAVFIVDISGSMQGAKMVAARTALRSALRGLLPGDRFRLLAFDDHVEAFRPDFVAFDDATLAKAEKWVAALDARGGTEMLAPLQAAFAGTRPEGRVRTVLLITDGQAGNDAELVAAVANRAQGARLFTLGIDTAVNGALLKQLARLGGGAATLCTPADDIEAVLAGIEARFGSPLLHDVRVEGEEARPEGRTVFAGRPVGVWLRGAPAEVRVTATGGSGPTTLVVAPARTTTGIAPLWARERVAWLEDRLAVRPFEEEALRPEIVRVALAAQIASRFTAFVAVERSRTVEGALQEVVQPVELPSEWNARAFLAGGGGAPLGGFGGAGSARTRAPGGQRSVVDAMRMGPPAPMASRPVPASPRAMREEALDAMMAPSAPPDKAKKRGVLQQVRALFVSEARAEFDSADDAPSAPDAALVQSQAANGSWANDPLRTAAALQTLVSLGHTRVAGLRKRAVQKAAAWLQAHRAIPEVAAALAALEAAEAALAG